MKHLVLVTGGTGYIGSHTVIELIEEGYDVVIVDDLSNSTVDVLDGIEKITGKKPAFERFDLCQRTRVKKFLRSYPGIQALIHFAAHKAVGESVEKPVKYYRNNLDSLMNLLEGMAEFRIPYMVFSSSCTVYGQPETLPVTEAAPVKKPGSPYGNTKKISEEIIRDFLVASPGHACISLRYFNPIGAHPSAHIGELPLGVPDNLVPFITQTAIGIRKELQVFGRDYNTPDGTAIRDYLHVVDLSRAHVASIRRLLEKKNKNVFEIFNLGTGRGYSVLEVIQSFERVSGIKLNYRFVARRPGDIEKVWADTTLANKELGWKAGKSLDEAMQSAWNWEKHYRSIAR
jgi:UDP-glucose 4-epimerase